MTAGWIAFEEEIGHWRESGRQVEFWWRDDDAGRRTRPLERLLALASAASVPLALAVVPAHADAELFASLPQGVEIVQHGVDHRDRSAPGEKKTEFTPSEPLRAALDRLIGGQATLAALGAGSVRPAALAPPWNRIAPRLIPHLRAVGFLGLSRFGPRTCIELAPGLTQVNTHVDLVAWRGDRGFVGEEEALRQAVVHLGAKRAGRADVFEPTGWLTHHACHDAAAWAFLERLFEATERIGGVRWRAASDLFLADGPS